jgi:hypothetical protein
MVERVPGQSLSDGRPDLICCPRCLGAGAYRAPITTPQPSCYEPRNVSDADAARALAEYQALTLAQWPAEMVA